MKELLKIEKTDKELSELKKEINFIDFPFNLYTPYCDNGFTIDQTYTEPYRLHKVDMYADNFGIENEIKNIDDYEEFSEELNDFYDNLENELKEKYLNKFNYLSVDIHSFNNHPFFIETQYDFYIDDSFDETKTINQNYIIKPNFSK